MVQEMEFQSVFSLPLCSTERAPKGEGHCTRSWHSWLCECSEAFLNWNVIVYDNYTIIDWPLLLRDVRPSGR